MRVWILILFTLSAVSSAQKLCEIFDCSGYPHRSKPIPPPSTSLLEVSMIISSSIFDQMLKYRNDVRCPSNGFYTYDAFIAAAQSFPGFATTGEFNTNRRELAAFFAQTSYETKGDDPNMGYCLISKKDSQDDVFCNPSKDWPCSPGKKYYGRGPIQLTHNYRYGPAGKDLGADLLNNPDLLATDPILSFKSAIWYWMTPQGDTPSSHDVITGRWVPSATDKLAGRSPGYGVISNIINGRDECGIGPNYEGQSRIGFYRRYCDLLGVTYGENINCYNQRPFA